MPGLHQGPPSSGSSRLFSDGGDGSGGGSGNPNSRVGPGGASLGMVGSYDGVGGVDSGMSGFGPSPGGGGRSPSAAAMGFGGGQRLDGMGYPDSVGLLRTTSGPPLGAGQRAPLGGGIIKGEGGSREAGDPFRKRPRESWRSGWVEGVHARERVCPYESDYARHRRCVLVLRLGVYVYTRKLLCTRSL